MFTAAFILLIGAFVCLVAHIVWPNIPLWIAVLFIMVLELLRVLPPGH
jgi:hypothetical protein